MNSRFLLYTFTLGCCLGCSQDDSIPAYTFKLQNLQGTLEGKSWVFQTGSAKAMEGMLEIVLYDLETVVPNACLPLGSIKSIIFTIPNQEGLYKLANLSSESPVTVTYFSVERQLNFITADGVVELSHLTETGIIGRMDLNWPVYENEFEGGNINGSFVIPICQ